MSQTNHLSRLIAILGVFVPVVAVYACTAAAQVVAETETKIDALQKIVADELSGKQEFIQAETDLLKLLKQLKTAREPAAGSREAKVLDRIGGLLIKVRARVPEPYAGGRGRPSRLPIPQFAKDKIIGQIAQRLQDSQADLLTRLKEDPESKQTMDLLVAVILDQEDLAWEVGWPFSEDEIKAYQQAGELTKEVYLSRRKRGVKQINEDLKADFEAVGREATQEFVIFNPPSDEGTAKITEQLVEKRGKAASAWSEDTKLFDETFQKTLFNR